MCKVAAQRWLSKAIMKFWILILVVSITGSAFGRLGDTEKQLTARYGKPVSVRPGGKYNPYFDKLMDFQKEGIAISCGLHAGRCVTIQYTRDTGFNSLEFEGFTLLNRAGSPVLVQRNATSLKYTFKKDYPEIEQGAKQGIRRMRKDVETFQQKS
jgi:hypothetical protein